MMAIQNQSRDQEDEWTRVWNALRDYFGDDAASQIAQEAEDWHKANGEEWRRTYDYAIRRGKEKLNAPVLDDVEYHEIMRAQEVMEGT